MIYKDYSFEKHGFVGHLAYPDTAVDRFMIIIMGGEKSIFPGRKTWKRLRKPRKK